MVPWNLRIRDFAAVGANGVIYSLGPIEIDARAATSQFAHLFAGTHDYLIPTFDLLKAHIVVEADAWICANAFVGPGVRTGERAIVGACAVVTREVDPATIVAGNPARFVRARPVQR